MGQEKRAVEEEDFRAFHLRTFGHVWTVLGRAGIRREAERHELAQEVYLVAHQKRATRKPSAPELAWVGCITRRMAWRFRALARTQKEQPVDEPDSVHEPIAAGPSPEDAVSGREQYIEVMESVGEDRREVFEMHKVEGFSIAEIAATLGKPAGTVSTLLRLAHEEIDVAVARLRAREARAGGAMALLPLGVGASGWREIGQLFDGPPPGMEEQVWRGVCRGLARAAVIGGGTAAVGVAVGKGAAFGAGLVVGGGAVGAAFALHLFGAEPPPSPPISRAPEVASVALAVTATASASESAPLTPGAPTTAQAAAPASVTSPQPAALDPEEERILSRAQTAYARGNRDEAMAALAEHARRFPRGALRADRERLRAKFNAPSQPSALDAGRAPHRLMGTDDD